LTSFSREDFLLPPLVLLAYYYFKSFDKTVRLQTSNTLAASRIWIVGVATAMLVMAALSVIFSAKVGSRFANLIYQSSATADPYSVKLTISSVFAAFNKLTFEYIVGPTIFSLIGVGLGLILFREKRFELITTTLIVLSIILPYTMIPNNLPAYRVVSWLPWFAGIGILIMQQLLNEIKERMGSKFGNIAISISVAFSVIILAQMDPKRQSMARWYKNQQILNNNIIGSLIQNSDMILKEKIVAVRGVKGLSPWSNTDAGFIRNKIKLPNKWVLLIDENSQFYSINYSFKNSEVHKKRKQSHVLVVKTSELCEMPDMLLLDFDENGAGSAYRSGQLCGQSSNR